MKPEKRCKEGENVENIFNGVRKKLGFGCMRLPMKDDEVDIAVMRDMVDLFLEKGFNYFDTAHGYVGGKSEKALRACLTSRYPRERYILADKLSSHFIHSEQEIRPMFEAQLEACGVEYFDFYLMHAQGSESFEQYKRYRAYETSFQLKAEGKIRHVGISFHDKADVLERILTEYPQIEVVQLQFNYVDYDDVSVESRKCYEVCVKRGIPVVVMEPVKGGSLATLPDAAQKILDALHGGSNASYAIRFAAGFENVKVVLSGMGSMEMMRDNAGYMENFAPLNDAEHAAIRKVRDIFRAQSLIPCTACCYCTDGCPKRIAIPDLFACMNAKKQFQNWNTNYYYDNVHTKANGKASDCVGCGRCERACPQHLPIRELLRDVAKEFER